MTLQNSAILLKFVCLLFGPVLLIAFDTGAQAAPISYSRDAVEMASSDGLVIKTVTRAGVAHRSARRTTRRVIRR